MLCVKETFALGAIQLATIMKEPDDAKLKLVDIADAKR